MAEAVGDPKWKVSLKRGYTKRLHGTANRCSRQLIFREIGADLGTLIHEMGHQKGFKHDWEFKRHQEALYRAAAELTNNFTNRPVICKRQAPESRAEVKTEMEQALERIELQWKKAQEEVARVPKPETPEEENEILETAISLLEDKARPFPTKSKLVITSYIVKSTLQALGIDTSENITFVREWLSEDYSIV